jgi:hypothetical protein
MSLQTMSILPSGSIFMNGPQNICYGASRSINQLPSVCRV